jgi:hypothetical protein
MSSSQLGIRSERTNKQQLLHRIVSIKTPQIYNTRGVRLYYKKFFVLAYIYLFFIIKLVRCKYVATVFWHLTTYTGQPSGRIGKVPRAYIAKCGMSKRGKRPTKHKTKEKGLNILSSLNITKCLVPTRPLMRA